MTVVARFRRPASASLFAIEARAARAGEIGRREAPARLQVDEERRPGRDRVEVVEDERHAGLARDREEMQDGVRRAARGGDGRDRVLEGGAREDLRRREAVGEALHDEPAGGARDRGLRGIRRGHVVRAHRRDAEERERRRHRVRGELAAARARARAGARLDVAEPGLGEHPRGVRAHGLEDVLDRDVLPVHAPGLDRPSVERDGREVEAREGHDRAGDRLVAAREGDDGVEGVTHDDELDGVGDDLAGDEGRPHAVRPHRDAVRDRDRAELERRPAGLADAGLHLLGEGAEGRVAGPRSVQEWTTATSGRAISSGVRPVARSIARAGARAGPFFIASLSHVPDASPFRRQKKSPAPFRGAGRLFVVSIASAGLHPARLKDEERQ